MATQKDIEWAKSQPERTKEDDKLWKEKENLADKVKKRYEEGAETRAMLHGLGIENRKEVVQEEPKDKDIEHLQTTIVTKSMDAQDKAMGRLNEVHDQAFTRLNDTTRDLKDELLRTQKEREEHLNRWLDLQLERIKEKQENADRAASNAMDAGLPSKSFNNYREVKTMLKEFVEELGISNKPPVNDSDIKLQLELEKIRQGLTIQLEEMKQNQTKADREFQLALKKLDMESKFKWADYEDKKTFRKEGLEGLQDITQSIAKAISSERTGLYEPANAVIKEFPCELCKTPVPIVEGTKQAICPNTECGTKYNLEPSGGV